MIQHPNHSPENLYTFAPRVMSLEQLKVFFRVYLHSISLTNKSSEIFLMQWEISIVFDYALMHHILPLLDSHEECDNK